MSRKTTIVLAVIAASLAAYILIFEREGLSDVDTYARRGSVFVEFDRERVTRISIARAAGEVVIERREGRDDDDEFSARYDLTEPVRAPADPDAVDALLSSIEWAEDRRRLEGMTAEDRKRFGLDDPPLSGSLVVAGREIAYRFGGDDPQGGGRYLVVGDESIVYVVGNDLFEAFDHDAIHFRSRELLEDESVSSAVSISLGETRVEQRDGRYWFGDGTLASETRVRELLSAFVDARALAFEDDTADLARFGFDRTFRIEASSEAREIVVRVGRDCTAGEERGHYMRVGNGPVACVSSETTDKLVLDPAAMREGRAIAMRSEDVLSIEVTDGPATVRLARTDDHWTVGDDVADDVAISELYDGLRRVTGEIVVVPEAEMASYGFGSRSIVFHAEDGSEGIDLGRVEAEVAFLCRRGEAAVMRVPSSAVDFFEASSLRYRSREIGTFDAEALETLTITRSGATETVRKGPDGYSYEPGPADIDTDHLRQLARLLAALRAERWVAPTADASHGFAEPVVTVSATFGLHDDHGHPTDEMGSMTLRVGVPTEGGAFARANDEPSVFVISSEVLEALERPLAQRSGVEP